ncbi:MAG: hypothetical protein ACYTXA_30730 [Nostoc sp.]
MEYSPLVGGKSQHECFLGDNCVGVARTSASSVTIVDITLRGGIAPQLFGSTTVISTQIDITS